MSLRVVFEDPDYQPACRWDGNVAANAIAGVPKPRVLRWTDWDNEGDYKRGCRLRGEVMTLACGTTIASDSVLHGDSTLPPQPHNGSASSFAPFWILAAVTSHFFSRYAATCGSSTRAASTRLWACRYAGSAPK